MAKDNAKRLLASPLDLPVRVDIQGDRLMKIKGIYQGNGEILVTARYGVGEQIFKRTFDKKNEPAVGSEVEIDIDSNGRDEMTVSQEAKYNEKKSVQDETPPAQPFFGETPKPRKPLKV